MQRGERLLEEGHRLPVGRPGQSLRTRLLQVRDRLLPHLAAESMVSHALDLLAQPIAVQRFDRLHDPGMERAPAVLQHAAVRDLVGQRVLEGVLEIREEARLVQELGRLEVSEPVSKAALEHIDDSLQERERHVLSDDGGRLQQPLVLGGQPVDARRQDRLSRRRDRPYLGRLRHAIGPPIPNEHLGLHQGLDALLEEERVALGPLDQHLLERLECRVVAQQGGQQLLGADGR